MEGKTETSYLDAEEKNQKKKKKVKNTKVSRIYIKLLKLR